MAGSHLEDAANPVFDPGAQRWGFRFQGKWIPLFADVSYRDAEAAYRDRVSLPDDTYERLLMLRTNLRRFDRWSAEQAHSAGLTPMQHQLLLAIRGHGDRRGPTIGEIADYLLLKHHSAGELVQRADVAGLVRRVRDGDDRRVVRIQLTDGGAARLESLTAMHLEELERLSLQLPQS